MQKVRFVPPTDLPFYGVRYLGAQACRFVSGEGRLSYWGPRFDGIKDYCKHHSLHEICAMQWKRCVETAERDFARIAEEDICRVRYKELTAQPSTVIQQITSFLGVDVPEEKIEQATSPIIPKFVGTWKTDLSQEDLDKALPILNPLLEKYGYTGR